MSAECPNCSNRQWEPDPGITDVVTWLEGHGYHVIAAGDGKTFITDQPEGYDHEPFAILMVIPSDGVATAREVWMLLRGAGVAGTNKPCDADESILDSDVDGNVVVKYEYIPSDECNVAEVTITNLDNRRLAMARGRAYDVEDEGRRRKACIAQRRADNMAAKAGPR